MDASPAEFFYHEPNLNTPLFVDVAQHSTMARDPTNIG
ncbi:MAG: hypothetical protein H6R26_2708 [Proteobacteria bacterium]|nr:hypothetical protein [Pseudomonadota bacterium]